MADLVTQVAYFQPMRGRRRCWPTLDFADAVAFLPAFKPLQLRTDRGTIRARRVVALGHSIGFWGGHCLTRNLLREFSHNNATCAALQRMSGQMERTLSKSALVAVIFSSNVRLYTILC
jgi:hypothetical protein